MFDAIAATVLASLSAIVFFPATQLRGVPRCLIWLVCSSAIAVSSCLVPLSSAPWRLVSSMVAIWLLVKLYDLFRSGDQWTRIDFTTYLSWLPNAGWLVIRRVPPQVDQNDDVCRLITSGVLTAVSLLLGVAIFSANWNERSFALEHTFKVCITICTVVSFTRSLAAAYRLLGGRTLDPMLDPVMAATPAEFWRRWNTPAQQFLRTYVFERVGGHSHPIRATLITFLVSGTVHEYLFVIASGRIQGWQLLFFVVQGLAVITTMRLRPKGWNRLLGRLLTILFQLAASVVFFQSVDAILPFYAARMSH